MAGVPTAWNAMLHAAGDADPADFTQLRVAVSGGASLPGEVARAFEARFDCAILEGHGLTETTAFGTFDNDGDECPPGTDGDLRIVDRIKDLIIRSGYNVYPGEVEEVLYEHPDIVEAAVIGVPDDHYGEEVAALIAARPGSEVGAAEVSSWARERQSAYKIPRIVRFVDASPKDPTGKSSSGPSTVGF
ncbi:AMP-binding protein [Streptomyces sp. NPDC051243]|uniref:AMP-binding enzyme n=1 Tax=Streptomyces sp. NPDC051243 TaxID=3365646 RepID=UPI003798D936